VRAQLEFRLAGVEFMVVAGWCFRNGYDVVCTAIFVFIFCGLGRQTDLIANEESVEM
jgi:hypothetical protein